jgi:hypothetical protein
MPQGHHNSFFTRAELKTSLKLAHGPIAAASDSKRRVADRCNHWEKEARLPERRVVAHVPRIPIER